MTAGPSLHYAPPAAALASPPSGLRITGTWLAYATAVAILLYPLAVVTVPPLVDYPNHLARLHILAAIQDNPTLQSIYEIKWALLPNLAMDLAALPLARLLGAYDAGRLFVAAIVVLPVAGTAALHRAIHGHVGLWPLCAALIAYNYVLFWGFLGYLFTIGLTLFALAGWIALEGCNPVMRAAVYTLVSLVLFICHLFAFAVFGLAIVAHELWRWRQQGEHGVGPLARFWLPTASQFFFPAILWFMSPVGTGSKLTEYGSFSDKMQALLSPVVFHGYAVERLLFMVVAVTAVWGLYKGWFGIAQRMRYPLMALTLAAVAMPSWLLNTWGADLRLPLVIACLFIAGSRQALPSVRMGYALAAVVVCLFMVRMALLSDQWRETDKHYAEFRQAVGAMERGSAILPTWSSTNSWVDNSKLAYWHLSTLAVIDRDAFVPTLFTDPVKQPVRVREPYRDIDANQGEPLPTSVLTTGGTTTAGGGSEYWARWPERFDYVLVFVEGPHPDLPADRLKRVSGAGWFEIYRVVRNRPRTAPAH